MSEDEESIGQQVNESIIVHDLGKGLLAGLVATAAVALLVFLKDALGLFPEFNVIEFFAKMTGSTGPAAGWMLLLISGVVLGVCFAVLDARVEIHPSTNEPIRGVLFGVLIWLALMLAFMPAYGGGLFGMDIGIGAPITLFVITVVHGFLSGLIYGRLNPENLSDA
jgi:hypothetical protein